MNGSGGNTAETYADMLLTYQVLGGTDSYR